MSLLSAHGRGALRAQGVLTRYAVRTLAGNPARTFVSIVGAALACALITAILGSAASLLEGLRTTTVATEGSWHYRYAGLTERGAERAGELADFGAVSVQRDYGVARLPYGGGGVYPTYLCALDYRAVTEGADGGTTLLPPVSLTAGRVPQKPGEVILPDSLRNLDLSLLDEGGGVSSATHTPAESGSGIVSSGELQVGSSVTLDLGTRTVALPDGSTITLSGTDDVLYGASSSTSAPEGTTEYLPEDLVDRAQGGPYTVVGFYDETYRSYGGGRSAAAYLIPRGDEAVRSCTVYGRLANAYDAEARARAQGLFDHVARSEALNGTPRVEVHEMLLGYEGVLMSGAFTGALAVLVSALALVVLATGVSLVYNAFSISVSERTRQFGLFASVGATARQLRGVVLLEALILALVAIPLGVGLGVGVTWAVFRAMGEGIAVVVGIGDASALSGGAVFAPWALALSAGLSLVPILVAAALPAWRACRVSALDAIRSADGDQGPRTRPHLRLRIPRPAILDRLRARLSVPAWLARRSLARSRSRGRVAVASLAVSVALLLATGALSAYLAEVGDTYRSTILSADVGVSLGVRLRVGEDVGDAIDRAQEAVDAYRGIKGVSSAGWYTSVSALGSAPRGMVARYTDSGEGSGNVLAGEPLFGEDSWYFDDGTYHGEFDLLFIDDASWERYVQRVVGEGDAAKPFLDPVHPRAIAYNDYRVNWDDRLFRHHPFRETGEVELVCDLALPSGTASVDTVFEGEDGTPMVSYAADDTEVVHAADEAAAGSVERVYSGTGLDPTPLSEAARQTYTLPVGQLTDISPDVESLSSRTSSPALVLPISALLTISESVDTARVDLGTSPYGTSYIHPFSFIPEEAGSASLWTDISVSAKDSARATRGITELNRAKFSGPGYSHAFASDFRSGYRQQRMGYEAIRVFTACFAAATSLIAVANVFNIVSTSMILRRREFAVLKSMGMGPRAFRRMIACECAAYAVRGLVLGAGLAAALCALLWSQWSMWPVGPADLAGSAGWLAVALAGTFAVLGFSAAYALRVSRSESIVESLRRDAA